MIYDPLTSPAELYNNRIRALARGAERVLDFGAGRGIGCIDLRLSGAHVVGCDVSPAVQRNPNLDSAFIIKPGKPLPFPDNHFDLIVSRYVLEHVEDGGFVAKELRRVLKPGGHFCAITPNRWGYVALGATVIPNFLHVAALKAIQPEKEAEDTFPTRYRMNTPGDIARHFGDGVSLALMSGPPSYTFGTQIGRKFFLWLHKTLPELMQTTMVIQYRKPAQAATEPQPC